MVVETKVDTRMKRLARSGFWLATAAVLILHVVSSNVRAQGGLHGVGGGPSDSFLSGLPSNNINQTLGSSVGFSSAADLARRVPPQGASLLGARGISVSLQRSTYRPVTYRDLAPGVKPSGQLVVRSIASLDFKKRGRFARLKETVLALAERTRDTEKASQAQLALGFRAFMHPFPIVDQPKVGYGFFSRVDLVGGGTVDPSVFLDAFTEDVQKSLGEQAFLDVMEPLIANRPPPEGADLKNLYDSQLAALGNYLFNNARYQWAGKAWMVLTTRNPDNATAARAYGLCLLAQGRLDEAAAELRRSFQVTEGWPDEMRIVGSNLQDILPRPEDLTDIRDEVQARFGRKSDPDLAFLLGFLDVFQGRWDAAKERLKRLAPEDEVAAGLIAVLDRGAVAESVRRPVGEEVQQLAKGVTGLEEPALTPAERAGLARALREGPDSYEDHMRLGDFRFFMGDFNLAGEAYRQAHKANPKDPYALFAMVHSAFANGEFRVAGRYLQKALAIEPDWALFEFRLQEFYGDVAEYEKHLDNLERLVSLRPDEANLKFLLAYVYYFSGRFADATDLLSDVLRLEPDMRRADYFLRLARLQG